MGYDLHLTRREDWSSTGNDISKDEFFAVIRADPEFHFPSEIGDDYVVWHSPKTGYQSWLHWNEGQIETKNPEKEFVDKLALVAGQLKANLQGDDGELYYSAATHQYSGGLKPLGGKPWWKFW